MSRRYARLRSCASRRPSRTEPSASSAARRIVNIRQPGEERPKSAFAKAVNYLHRQWAALTLFLSKPMIEIHNNRSELLLRGPVTGRHAWLFAGSPNGAEASAIWFSLVASCMLQGIDPAVYLRAVLPGLSKKTPTQVRALTPAKWAEARRTEGAVA